MSLEMHPCPRCPAEFDSLRSLEHHLKTYHDDAQPADKFRCTTCDAEFMQQMEWLVHERAHKTDGARDDTAAA